MQAAAGAEDHEDVNIENALGSKGNGFDKNSAPQIAGNLAPPSESRGANGEDSTVCASATLDSHQNAHQSHQHAHQSHQKMHHQSL